MTDNINPQHYQFSNGVQTIDISENLTGNGAQAVQYVTRATRLDGFNKGDQIEDLTKAIWFCNREIGRLTGLEIIDAEVVEPRKFMYLNEEIPAGVQVNDEDGDLWFRLKDDDDETWRCENREKSRNDVHPTGGVREPFTEVLP